MKKERIVFVLLTVFLLFTAGNRICSANIETAAKPSFFPQTHSKQHFSASFGKVSDNSADEDSLFSTDSIDDDFSFPADYSNTDIDFVESFIVSALLFLLFFKFRKPETAPLSPYTITVKKYLLIRSIRI